MRQHRDRTVARPAEPKGTRDNVVQIRVSDEELRQVRSRAQASGRSVTEVVRFCVFGEVARNHCEADCPCHECECACHVDGRR
jgi:hypothetical protein